MNYFQIFALISYIGTALSDRNLTVRELVEILRQVFAIVPGVEWNGVQLSASSVEVIRELAIVSRGVFVTSEDLLTASSDWVSERFVRIAESVWVLLRHVEVSVVSDGKFDAEEINVLIGMISDRVGESIDQVTLVKFLEAEPQPGPWAKLSVATT